jgi:GR25 family glycosyltransferase involved in LPS biosynthesis
MEVALFDMKMIVFEKDEQRNQNFTNTKNRLSFLKKFPAIDSVNNIEDSNKINKQHNLNTEYITKHKFKGKLGCNLSHQMIWKEHLENEMDWILILEDDTDVIVSDSNNFVKIINEIIKYANKNNNHFVQLETRNHHLPDQLKQKKTKVDGLFQMKPQCGTGAYLINKYAIEYFFQFLPWDKFIDVYTNNILHIQKLNSLCLINTIFKTMGAQREIDNNSKYDSIIYRYK